MVELNITTTNIIDIVFAAAEDLSYKGASKRVKLQPYLIPTNVKLMELLMYSGFTGTRIDSGI